jgi:hypothetical protein
MLLKFTISGSDNPSMQKHFHLQAMHLVQKPKFCELCDDSFDLKWRSSQLFNKSQINVFVVGNPNLQSKSIFFDVVRCDDKIYVMRDVTALRRENTK